MMKVKIVVVVVVVVDRGSQAGKDRSTKYCTCHGNLRFKVHKVLHLSQNLHFKYCACHEIRTSRSTKYGACHEICTSRSTKYCACHNFRKRATCPKVTIHCACHEIRTCRRPPCPKYCACHKICTSTSNCSDLLNLSQKVDFRPPKPEVSLAPATKSDRQVPKCARHHNESAPPSSTVTLCREIALGNLRTELFCEPAQPKRRAQRAYPDRTGLLYRP